MRLLQHYHYSELRWSYLDGQTYKGSYKEEGAIYTLIGGQKQKLSLVTDIMHSTLCCREPCSIYCH